MTEKNQTTLAWYQKTSVKIGLIVGIILIIALVLIFIFGSSKFNFIARLTANYTDPTQTFKVYFPNKNPILIDGSFTGYPLINYYEVEPKTSAEYRVSYITDVNSLLGVSAVDLIKNTGEAVITALSNTGSDMNLELVILKNETTSDGLQIMDAQILDKNDTQYQLYKIIGRGNELFIVRATGSSKYHNKFQHFLRSFNLLNQNQQNLNVDLTNEMVESVPVVVDESQQN